MRKVKKSVKGQVKVRVADKTKSKVVLPQKDTARLVVLLNGIKAKQVKLNQVVDLAKLRLGGKLFQDLISSRPLIGTTTRSGLKKAGYAVECVKAHPENKKLWAVIKIAKA